MKLLICRTIIIYLCVLFAMRLMGKRQLGELQPEELVSTILQNDIKNTAVTYVKDESGKYAYYTDEYKLKKEGKLGRRSKLERVFYDWNTGEEVKRELVSEDYYSGERDTYWVGVHKP